MEVIIGLSIIASMYLWVLFMDMFFRSCSHYAYLQFLKGTGLEIKFLQIKWSTNAFNDFWTRSQPQQSHWINLWFNVGLVVSLLSLPLAIITFFYAFLQNFIGLAADPEDRGTIIEPALPGVNLPFSELGYYSITLLISSLVHEFGHALAAVHEDVNITDVGASLIFILPIAYVNVNADKLASINPWKRLKILCAGVWHNLFLAIVAYVLYVSIPYLFVPLFVEKSGVIVTELMPQSPLLGPKGLAVGNIITNINSCKIADEDSYYACLKSLRATKPGFCIESNIVHDYDESVHLKHLENGLVSCCRSDNEGKLCFEYLDVKDSVLELPPYVCLPGRKVVEMSHGFCTGTPHLCPSVNKDKVTFCFRPLLTNATNLFKIQTRSADFVIYLGSVSDLSRTVRVSSFIPKYDYISWRVPDAILKFLGYVIVFSTGLALVNILPCLFMDGQHIINTLFHIFLSEHLRISNIKLSSGIVTGGFTLLLIIHCVVVISNKYF